MIRKFYKIVTADGEIESAADARGFCFQDGKILRDLSEFERFWSQERDGSEDKWRGGEKPPPIEPFGIYVSIPPTWTGVVSETVYVPFAEVSHVVVTETDDARPEIEDEDEEEEELLLENDEKTDDDEKERFEKRSSVRTAHSQN